MFEIARETIILSQEKRRNLRQIHTRGKKLLDKLNKKIDEIAVAAEEAMGKLSNDENLTGDAIDLKNRILDAVERVEAK